MAKKFDLIQALKEQGFSESTNQFGCRVLSKHYIMEVEVAWYGKQKTEYKVVATFNQAEDTVRAEYYVGSFGEPDKVKVHLTDKRAYNAIKATVENKGFKF